MTSLEPLILDACVMINLWASGEAKAVLAAAGYRPVVTRQAADEALWIDRADEERRRIDCDALACSGIVEIWSCIDDELETLVALAASLGDGEAASLAIGKHRGIPVATDDRPARRAARRLDPVVRLVSTSELLRTWGESAGLAAVAKALREVEDGASFVPPGPDPNREWWSTTRALWDGSTRVE